MPDEQFYGAIIWYHLMAPFYGMCVPGITWGFWGQAIQWGQSNFKTTDPGCHASFYIKYPPNPCVYGIFRIGLLNAFRQILPWLTPIALATKYKTKSNITRLVYESEILAFNRGFGGQAIQWCQSNFKTTDTGSYGNETWNIKGYNSACMI